MSSAGLLLRTRGVHRTLIIGCVFVVFVVLDVVVDDLWETIVNISRTVVTQILKMFNYTLRLNCFFSIIEI